jgi:hypothetical protein
VLDPESLNPDPDPAFQVTADPGFGRPKIEKNTTEKDVQATGEAFSPQIRTFLKSVVRTHVL